MTGVSKDIEFSDIDGYSTLDADDADENLRYKGVGTSSYYPTAVYLAEVVPNPEANIYSKTSYDYVDRTQIYYEEPTMEATTADYVYVTENCTQPRHQPEEKDFAEHHCLADLSYIIPRVFLAIAITVIIATAVVFTVFAFSLFTLKEDIRTLSDNLSANSTLGKKLSDMRTRLSDEVMVTTLISSLNGSMRTVSGDVESLNVTAQHFVSSLQTTNQVLNNTNATFQVVEDSLAELRDEIAQRQHAHNGAQMELNSTKIKLNMLISGASFLEARVQNLEKK